MSACHRHKTTQLVPQISCVLTIVGGLTMVNGVNMYKQVPMRTHLYHALAHSHDNLLKIAILVSMHAISNAGHPSAIVGVQSYKRSAGL